MSNLYYHFKLYIDVANANKNNTLIYFLLKNYAFKMVFSALGSYSSALNETEKALFDRFQAEFHAEKMKNPDIPLVSDIQYKAFLEEFFKTVDFEQANLDTINICKDLTEVLAIYGPLDDLYKKRSIDVLI
jgi:hypothetical protein